MVLTKELMIPSAAAIAAEHRAKMPSGVAIADASPGGRDGDQFLR